VGAYEDRIWVTAAGVYHDAAGGHFYFLHPEFVETDGSGAPIVLLCPDCREHVSSVPQRRKRQEFVEGRTETPPKPPPLSLAAGVRYGRVHALGLPSLSTAEQLVLARARTYAIVIKLTSVRGQVGNVAYRGHTIAFPHSGAERVADALAQDPIPAHAVSEEMCFSFVGPRDEREESMLQRCLAVHGRVDAGRIAAWLRVFSILRPAKWVHSSGEAGSPFPSPRRHAGSP
jgi:hypothetical protein